MKQKTIIIATDEMTDPMLSREFGMFMCETKSMGSITKRYTGNISTQLFFVVEGDENLVNEFQSKSSFTFKEFLNPEL